MNDDLNLLLTNQEKYFFETFSLIRQITFHRLKPSEMVESEDLWQEVKLSLLIWKRNHPDLQLTQEEWLKFVNRVTCNKIKAFRRNQIRKTSSLSKTDENEICLLAREKSQTTQFQGNTTMELHLLMSRMWEVIKTQSFFENQVLLLKNDELFSSLIYYRGCRLKELAEQLQLTQNELDEVIKRLPLSDQQIALFLAERFQIKATPAAIRKARQKATDQVLTAIKQKPRTKQNGKASKDGKT